MYGLTPPRSCYYGQQQLTDIPPTIMGILGGEYRNLFFGNDSLNHKTDDSFAIVVYNMKRYGIVSDRALIVLTETGEEISYQRDGVMLFGD